MSPTSSARERRAFERHPIVGEVSYRGTEQLEALDIHDLSAGGIRLVLSGPETVGRDVAMTIAIAGDEPVETRGRVVWARQAAPFATGIRFFAPERRLQGSKAP